MRERFTIEMFLQYSIHSERETRAGRQKGLLVLETIFSYPTRAGEELLHKNTSIRERESEKKRERGGGEQAGGRAWQGGGEDGDSGGDGQHEWVRDGELSLSLSAPPQ